MDSVKDVAAIFVAEFQATQGHIIDWSLTADDSVSLDGVEFNVLPSGVHAVEKDVIYFTKDGYQGVAIYRRIATDEVGMRGARMISVGILVAKTTRPRPWRHITSLKRFSIHLEDNPKVKGPLEAYFKEHMAPELVATSEESWSGWENELSQATMEHPAFHLPHVLKIFGISSLTIFKHALGRRRILIYATAPVESACLLAQLAAVIASGEEGDSGVHENKISVLGVIGLTDLDRLGQETRRGNGWIACTTDAIFLEKPQLFDLLIDLTSASASKANRPSLSASRLVEGSSPPIYKLQTIRFTWSDFKLWSELEDTLRSLTDDGHNHGSSSRNEASKSRWVDPWQLYEDVCLVCAGMWMGSKPPRTEDTRSRSSSFPPLLAPDRSGDTSLRPSSEFHKNQPSFADSRIGPSAVAPTLKARIITLSLLSTFHNHTAFLMSKLKKVLSTSTESRQGEPIVLTPRGVMTFELGPMSDLDARFIEWLAEVKGRKITVKRGWRDLLGFLFGFP